MLPQLEVMGAQLGARLAKLGTMLAHPAAYVALFKPMLACGLGGLGLVGRGLCMKVLGLVGEGWSVVVGAFGFGVGGLGLVGRGLRFLFQAMWAHFGAMLAHLGARLAHLRAMTTERRRPNLG